MSDKEFIERAGGENIDSGSSEAEARDRIARRGYAETEREIARLRALNADLEQANRMARDLLAMREKELKSQTEIGTRLQTELGKLKSELEAAKAREDNLEKIMNGYAIKTPAAHDAAILRETAREWNDWLAKHVRNVLHGHPYSDTCAGCKTLKAMREKYGITED